MTRDELDTWTARSAKMRLLRSELASLERKVKLLKAALWCIGTVIVAIVVDGWVRS